MKLEILHSIIGIYATECMLSHGPVAFGVRLQHMALEIVSSSPTWVVAVCIRDFLFLFRDGDEMFSVITFLSCLNPRFSKCKFTAILIKL